MTDYVFGGPADIDRAIALLVNLDEAQTNAMAILEIDAALDELEAEFEKCQADAAYVPDKDFIATLSGYLAWADDKENPKLK